ncbi:MAG: hypothetical protein JXX14_10645 [Deltaproteobacteria bacterium]|nr:hypothetical protein [Deltaproteobacteria bacterium]
MPHPLNSHLFIFSDLVTVQSVIYTLDSLQKIAYRHTLVKVEDKMPDYCITNLRIEEASSHEESTHACMAD